MRTTTQVFADSTSGSVRFQVIVLEAVEAVRQVQGVKAVKTEKVRIEREG